MNCSHRGITHNLLVASIRGEPEVQEHGISSLLDSFSNCFLVCYICDCYSCITLPMYLFKAGKEVQGYVDKNIQNVVCLSFSLEN